MVGFLSELGDCEYSAFAWKSVWILRYRSLRMQKDLWLWQRYLCQKKVKVQFFLPKPVEHLQTLKDVNSLTQCNTFNHQSYLISDMNLVYQSQTFTVIHSWPRWGRTWGRIWSVKWKAQRQPFRHSQHHRLVKALSSLQDTLICEEESSAKCPRNVKHLQISDFSLKTHCSNIHCHASCHFFAKLEAIL